MYGKSADYYDALYSFKDYDAAVATLQRVLDEVAPEARTLLDVACGTGLHLERLQQPLRGRGARHQPGDARDRAQPLPGRDLPRGRHGGLHACRPLRRRDVPVQLDRVRPHAGAARVGGRLDAPPPAAGGVILLEPWFTPERFWTHTITANHVDEPDLKITWMYTSEREGDVAILDMHYLVGRPERHRDASGASRAGAVQQDQITSAFAAAGLECSLRAGRPVRSRALRRSRLSVVAVLHELIGARRARSLGGGARRRAARARAHLGLRGGDAGDLRSTATSATASRRLPAGWSGPRATASTSPRPGLQRLRGHRMPARSRRSGARSPRAGLGLRVRRAASGASATPAAFAPEEVASQRALPARSARLGRAS